MKIQSPDTPHKSEVGGVRVNIATKGEVFLAFEALVNNVRKHRPQAAIQGVLLGPMAKRGVEIIVGTMTDKTFGPMMMVSLGGITTELFRDVVYRPAPVGAEEAASDAGGLESRAAAEWISRSGEGGCAALSQLIVDISVLAARHAKKIAEIELSPVLVYPEGQGVTIVDTLVAKATDCDSPTSQDRVRFCTLPTL